MGDLARLRHAVECQDADCMLGSEAFDMVHRLRLASLEILDLIEAGIDKEPDAHKRLLEILDTAWLGGRQGKGPS
jgi:hypothetical protein